MVIVAIMQRRKRFLIGNSFLLFQTRRVRVALDTANQRFDRFAQKGSPGRIDDRPARVEMSLNSRSPCRRTRKLEGNPSANLHRTHAAGTANLTEC